MLARLIGFSLLTQLATAQTLTVTPARALMDDPIVLRATGLKPRQEVVLRASWRTRSGQVWRASATFVADGTGTVDAGRDAAMKGDYTGVDAMGLFWSMKPGEKGEAPKDARVYTLELEAAGKVVATAEVLRAARYPETVDRSPVAEPEVVGTFFAPKGAKGLPAVVVLSGSEGGLNETWAAALASRGFAALTVGYMKVSGRPNQCVEIPLETFTQGAAWLAKRPEVDPRRIAILGGSKGAEAALATASAFPDRFQAVVAVKPSSRVWQGLYANPMDYAQGTKSSWTLGGKPLPFATVTFQSFMSGFMSGKPVAMRQSHEEGMKAAPAESVIPVERIPAPLLLVAGDADALWPSGDMARESAARRKGASRDEVVIYPKAGHGIGLPGLPVVEEGMLLQGGEPAANAAASLDAWPRIVAFLRSRLERPVK